MTSTELYFQGSALFGFSKTKKTQRFYNQFNEFFLSKTYMYSVKNSLVSVAKLLHSVQLPWVFSRFLPYQSFETMQLKGALFFYFMSTRASLKYFSKLESEKAKRTVFVVDNEVFTNGKHEKSPLSSKWINYCKKSSVVLLCRCSAERCFSGGYGQRFSFWSQAAPLL